MVVAVKGELYVSVQPTHLFRSVDLCSWLDGQELVDAAHGPDGKFFQCIFEPGSRFNVVELCGGKQALYGCRPFTRAFATCKL